MVENPPANAGDTSSVPGSEDSLEEEMATHSSILAWEIPWTEEPNRLQSMGSQKNRTQLSTHARGTFCFWIYIYLSVISIYHIYLYLKHCSLGLPSWSVVKNLPSSIGDTGLISGWETKIPYGATKAYHSQINKKKF